MLGKKMLYSHPTYLPFQFLGWLLITKKLPINLKRNLRYCISDLVQSSLIE